MNFSKLNDDIIAIKNRCYEHVLTPVNPGTASPVGGPPLSASPQAPQEFSSPEPSASPHCTQEGSPAAGGESTPSPAALSLSWDQEQISLEFHMGEISEFEAIRALMDTGLGVCEAMEYLEVWE